MTVRYSPMLKTRGGEITALANLRSATKDRIFPIFHITQSISQSFAPRLSAEWSGRSLAVDGSFSFNAHGNPLHFSALITALRNGGVHVQPSISVGADPFLVNTALQHMQQSGIVIKSNLNELSNISGFLQSNSINPSNVDLVLDMGHVSGFPIAAFAPFIAGHLNQMISSGLIFREVSLAAAAAPKDHGDLPRGRSVVPRSDFQLWQQTAPLVSATLHYGDYATGHPDLSEPPGAAMSRATVSARYSDTSNWIVIKGHPTTGASGIPMPTQYLSHATNFVQDPSFGQVPGCWADQQISMIAAGSRGAGNRTTWAEIAANRHMELVVMQLP